MKIMWKPYSWWEIPTIRDVVGEEPLRIPLGQEPQALPCDSCGVPTTGRALKDGHGWVPCCRECSQGTVEVEALYPFKIEVYKNLKNTFGPSFLSMMRSELSDHPLRREAVDGRSHTVYATRKGLEAARRELAWYRKPRGYWGEVCELTTGETFPL